MALLIIALLIFTIGGLDPVMNGKILLAEQHIRTVNTDVDARAVAKELVFASYNANLGEPANYKLLLAIARYESTFDPDAIGAAGERGLLQLHPCHCDNVRLAGLDPTKHEDCTLYAAIMLATSIAKGKTLEQALEPWTVGKRALALFEDMHAGILTHDNGAVALATKDNSP